MRLSKSWFSFSFAASLAIFSLGCNAETEVEDSQPIQMDGPPPDLAETADGHDHQGPHGGQIIELGRTHEFHAEIVEDDEARLVTVHILGGEMQPWPIEQEAITLSLLVDGAARSFELQAKDPADGKSSRFVATDSESFAALHESEATGKLLVTIEGKSYSGDIEHHDH